MVEERIDGPRDRLDVGDGETGLGEPAGRFQRHLLGPAAGGRELGQDHDMHGVPPGDRVGLGSREDEGERFTGDQPRPDTDLCPGSERRNS